MRIYTSVEWEWDDSLGKMVEVSSDSYDYDGDCHQCGGGDDGQDERQTHDKEVIGATTDALDLMADQYYKGKDPTGSFYGKEIQRLGEETAIKKTDVNQRTDQQISQAKDTFNLTKQQGVQSYQQQVQDTAQKTKRIQSEGVQRATEARSAGAEEAFSALDKLSRGGLAGVGGRARKTLAARRSGSVGKVADAVSSQKRDATDSLAAAETAKFQNLTSGAQGLEQTKDTANLMARQELNQLDRDLQSQTGSILQDQSSMLDSLRANAAASVGTAIGSFSDSESDWTDFNTAQWGNDSITASTETSWDDSQNPFNEIDDFWEGGG